MSGVNGNELKKLVSESALSHSTTIKVAILVVFGFLENFYIDEFFKCPCYDDPIKNCPDAKIYSALLICLSTAVVMFIATGVSFAENFSSKVKDQSYNKKTDDSTQKTSDKKEDVEAGKPEKTDAEPSGKPDKAPEHPLTATINDFIRVINENRSEDTAQKSKCEKFCQIIIIVIVWISIILLDGDYVACVAVCNPYQNKSCTEIRKLRHDELPFSDSFGKARRISQLCGALTLVAGACVFMFVQICPKDCCARPTTCLKKISCCNDCCNYCCCSRGGNNAKTDQGQPVIGEAQKNESANEKPNDNVDGSKGRTPSSTRNSGKTNESVMSEGNEPAGAAENERPAKADAQNERETPTNEVGESNGTTSSNPEPRHTVSVQYISRERGKNKKEKVVLHKVVRRTEGDENDQTTSTGTGTPGPGAKEDDACGGVNDDASSSSHNVSKL